MVQRRLSYYWMILSLQSGIINAAGFVLFSTYLTHMSGIFAKIGLEAEQLHSRQLLWWLSVPLAFVVGALVSTVWIEGQARRRNNPRYEWVFLLMAACFVAIGFTEFATFIGPYSIWLIAFCAGAQNAIFNERSGAILRTTHFTGTTTDLGISLARVFFKTLGGDKDRLEFESRLAGLRAGSIASFVLGSALGTVLVMHWGPRAFWLPAAICLVMSYDSTKVLKVLQARAKGI